MNIEEGHEVRKDKNQKSLSPRTVNPLRCSWCDEK